MCGLAGILDLSAATAAEALAATARDMAGRLASRGPDEEDHFVDGPAGLALGHRRLKIIDLSPAGRQPMTSASGRYVIAYNGEVYNFVELRRELSGLGHSFRGGSDTEVLLEACDAWGLDAALERLNGMFAFALWDRDARRLSLCRDRLGIKPLYWTRQDHLVLFASTPAAFGAHPDWNPVIDRDALAAYLRFAYVPAPWSIWRGVRKLLPGQVVTIAADGTCRERRYWDLRATVERCRQERAPMDEAEAVAALDGLLRDAVGRQMVADVPLGAFLSGGLDSTTVVALMQAQSPRPVRSFTVGFPEADYDEAPHARAVAKHLGTDHTELMVTPAEALDVVPRLAEWHAEPFADASQIPTYLIARLTRDAVTVALSGDGGDEVFAGYNRYLWAERVAGGAGALPGPLRRGASRLVRAVPPRAWDAAFAAVPAGRRPRQAGDKMHKLATILELDGVDAAYRRLVSQWDRPEALLTQGREPHSPVRDQDLTAALPDPLDRMRYLDMATYLPDDILTKVDRATMAVGLESRVPLLDHRVVEFAWRLPREVLLAGGQPKRLLRRIAEAHVPSHLIDRPKSGFTVPLDAWLRGPLRPWAEDLLAEARLAGDGVFNPAPIRKAWTEHLAGRCNHQYPLWTVLMFQAWHDRWD
jgi:asparagine synthase (glutamine-hydrolysing)